MYPYEDHQVIHVSVTIIFIFPCEPEVQNNQAMFLSIVMIKVYKFIRNIRDNLCRFPSTIKRRIAFQFIIWKSWLRVHYVGFDQETQRNKWRQIVHMSIYILVWLLPSPLFLTMGMWFENKAFIVYLVRLGILEYSLKSCESYESGKRLLYEK